MRPGISLNSGNAARVMSTASSRVPFFSWTSITLANMVPSLSMIEVAVFGSALDSTPNSAYDKRKGPTHEAGLVGEPIQATPN